MKTFSKWGKIGLATGLFVILGSSYFAFSHFLGNQKMIAEANSDPLAEFFQDVEKENNGLMAKMFGLSTIPVYNGPIGDSLKECIKTAPKSAGKGLVYGEYNQAAVITSAREEVTQELTPVLGYAYRKTQIDWDWNPPNRQYVFYTAKGQESLWWCYFRGETNFFKNFFKQDQMKYDLEGGIETKDSDGDGVLDTQEAADGTNILDALSYKDTDGDKVPDAIETIDGTSISDKTKFKDTDAGGTPDYVETVLFTKVGLPASNPSTANDDTKDTDAGSVSDYQEVKNGTNPLVATDDLPITALQLLATKQSLFMCSTVSLSKEELQFQEKKVSYNMEKKLFRIKPVAALPDGQDEIYNHSGELIAHCGGFRIQQVVHTTCNANETNCQNTQTQPVSDPAECSLPFTINIPSLCVDTDSDGDGVPNRQEDIDGTSKTDPLSYKDTDGDKIPDVVELKEGSNPENKSSFRDTDGGGVADYIETVRFPKMGLPATNISSAADDTRDSDNGGMSDYIEILGGTNPKDGTDDFKNITCTTQSIPVCGLKNNEKKTYTNICVLSKDGATKVSDGECPIVPNPVNGVCGTAHGSAVSSIPATNLCGIGTSSVVAGTGPWTWTCSGTNGGTNANCTANQTPTPVNGTCGTSHGTTVSSSPTTNLCATGTASSVAGPGPWLWSCDGTNGGKRVDCSANKTPTPIDGKCGFANGVAVSVAPTINLCSFGTETTVSGTGPWTWSCNGINTGSANVNCTAPKLIPTVDCTNGDAMTKAICKGYQDILQKNPDYEGYSYWYTEFPKVGVTANDQGLINDYIRTAAIARGEMTALSCPTLACKIVKAYRDILNRAPDTAGYNYWITNIAATATQAEVNAYIQNAGTNTGTNLGNCPSNASAQRGTNKEYTCTCSAAQTTSGNVWGTTIYTDDSNICRAALHNGTIGTAGGNVIFKPVAGESSYIGSTKNGVASQNYTSWVGSYMFVSGSGTQTVDCTSGDAMTKAICKGYQDILGKSPDYAGYSYWYTDLPKNGVTANDQGIINDYIRTSAISAGTITADYCPSLACKIVKAYRDILKRAPDSAGYNYWLTSIPANSTQAVVNQYLQNASGGNTGGVISLGNCPDTADGYKTNIGQQYKCTCSIAQTSSGNVVGTSVYTSTSSLCRSAVHAGMQQSGTQGNLTFQIETGQSSYTGSTQKGITSQSSGSSTGSFRCISGESFLSDTPNTGFWVTGYIPGYNDASPITNEDYSMLSGLIHFAGTPKSDGGIEMSTLGMGDETKVKARISEAHAHGKKIVFALRNKDGAMDHISAISGSNRTTFINNLKNIIQTYNYDGIDIDFETVMDGGDSAGEQYKSFIPQLRSELDTLEKTMGKELYLYTSIIPERDGALVGAIDQYFDQINLMVYDVYWPYAADRTWGVNFAWFDAPMETTGKTGYSVKSMVQGAIKNNIAKNKIGLGISFHIKCWTGTNGVTKPFDTFSSAGVSFLSPNQMPAGYSDKNWIWDNQHQSGMYYMASNNTWCTYNGPRGVQEKIQYAKTEGLGGVMLWNMALDNDTTQNRPLRKAVQDAIGGTTPPAVVNGKCGSADKTSVDTQPTTNLCDPAGKESSMTTTPTGWSWTCAGTGTGAPPASCSATKTVVATSCSTNAMTQAVCNGFSRIFNRTPDSASIKYWSDDFTTQKIVSTDTTKIDIALYNSGKANGELATCSTLHCKILSAYKTILARDPDAAGYNYWISSIPASSTQAKVNEYIQTSSFSWVASTTFGSCSKTCGTGTQSAPYICQSTETKTTVVDSKCFGAKPADKTQSCNTQACPINGGWSNWDTCSASCGGGTQSRTCSNPYPANGGTPCSGLYTQSCNTQACVVTITCSTDSLSSTICSSYQNVLQRTVDSASLKYWYDSLKKSGVSLRGQVDLYLYTSALADGSLSRGGCKTLECKITASYYHILGRAPDEAGLTYWLGDLSNTLTQAQVDAYFK